MKKSISVIYILITSAIIYSCQNAYSQEYEYEWIGWEGYKYAEIVYNQCFDKYNNIYLTGFFSDTLIIGQDTLVSYNANADFFIIKLTKDGLPVWAKSAGSYNSDQGNSIIVDNNLNVYITGSFQGTVLFDTISVTSYGQKDMFVAKLDSLGNFIWVKNGGGPTFWDTGIDICLDEFENLYLTGYFKDDAIFGNLSIQGVNSTDIFIVKMSNKGDFLWALGACGMSNDQPTSLSYNRGYLSVTGTFIENIDFGITSLLSSGEDDMFICKLDSSGVFIWAKKCGGIGNDWCESVYFSDSALIVITGSFEDEVVFGNDTLHSTGSMDAFVSQLDTSGNFIWTKMASGSSHQRATDIAVNTEGNILIGGDYYNTIHVGDTVLYNSGSGWTDAFYAMYDRNGGFLWAKKAGSEGSDFICSLGFDNENSLLVTGRFDDPIYIGFDTVVGYNYLDIFLIKLTPVSNICLKLNATLQGPFSLGQMNTLVNTGGFLPHQQPYSSSPWFHTGAESVASIPSPDIVDWVLIELRETSGGPETAIPDSIIHRQAAFLMNDGSIKALDGTSLPVFSGDFYSDVYAVVWHRNHLPVMSSGPVVLSNDTLSWDFTTGTEQAYGGANAQRYLGYGKFGMYSGDGNADGQIANTDKNDVWVPQAGTTGYLSGDYNMDSDVNNGDKNDLWIPNTGRGSQVPD